MEDMSFVALAFIFQSFKNSIRLNFLSIKGIGIQMNLLQSSDSVFF